jgi:hypothetical protein
MTHLSIGNSVLCVGRSRNVDKYYYAILKDCLSRKRGDWIASQDDVLSVGHILANEYIITTAKDMLDFVEKPWHWEPEMRDLIVDHELEQIASDMDNLLPLEAISALSWLESFGYEQKAVDALETALSEREYCLC